MSETLDRGATAVVAPARPANQQEDSLALHWLPEDPAWTPKLKVAEQESDPAAAWSALVGLANVRMDFIRTTRLDRSVQRMFGAAPPPVLATKPIRLAVLGSSTVGHLLPAMRVAGLRRDLWVTTYEADYGQYLQELNDPGSELHQFKPTAILFAFDAYHLLRGADAAAGRAQGNAILQSVLDQLSQCWRLARDAFRCQIIQQTVLPVFSLLLGNNEHRLPGSRQWLAMRLNSDLRDAADAAGVDLLAVDTRAMHDGVSRWHDPLLWHRAKQEVSPAAAPLYGDLLGRLLAAQQGRSFKCLVLDLDNTLWGGVIGDDGLEGIVLGQGSALGEGFVAFQAYARELGQRGVILAVCSKNDEANALAPFEQHPEMVLRREDIACFSANWENKASNIRLIAQRLNIGLDAMVFVDDNPFERNLVRRELPMVAVPEVPDDPALVPACLAAAGYFEGLTVTEEDRERGRLYQANAAREELQAQVTDLSSYLRSLEMQLVWRRFDRIGFQRIVQLINKTNQFNLMTRRYSDDDVLAVMNDPTAFGVQFRLLDRVGDNGIIAIVIGRSVSAEDVVVDTWLMSCRVLGRQVEEATLAVVAEAARALGARRLLGDYRPTAKNGMVKDHYAKLGFAPCGDNADGGRRFALDLPTFPAPELFITIREG